jgi:hypothetical protein
MDLPAELRELALNQDGLITRQQALARGMTDAAIRHALDDDGSWRRVVWDVYATFTGALLERHYIRAALLYAGDEAMLTGTHACRGYGMEYLPHVGTPVLLVPAHVKRAKIEVARIVRVGQPPAARTVNGIPCAPPERAALDAVRKVGSLRQARASLCEVVQRRLTTIDRLVDELSKVDLRGMGYARMALADVQAGCRSAPECELRDLMLTSAVIPAAVWNEPLPTAPELIPDAYIEEARLVLEVESVQWHRFGDGPEVTERRRARYASLGLRVLPISPQRIRDEPNALLAEIEAAVRVGLGEAA